MAITNPAPTYEPIDVSVTQETPLLVPNPVTKILEPTSRSLSTTANSIVIGSGSPTL